MTGATVGKIGMMPRTETSFYLNQRVGIFRPKVEMRSLFLFCFYNEPSAKNAVESLASGAAQPNISGGQLEASNCLSKIWKQLHNLAVPLKVILN